MDLMNILIEHFEVVVMLGCLVLGYLIKHASFFKWIKNNDIPVILSVVGAVLSVLVTGLSVENIVYGAAMGLLSTGAHEWFKSIVENAGKMFNLGSNK